MSATRKLSNDDTAMSQLKKLCRENPAVRDELFKLSDDITSAKWRMEVKKRYSFWLSADSQVTRWRRWALDVMDQELLNDQLELRAEQFRQENPQATPEQIRQDGIAYFMEQARARDNCKQFLDVLALDQLERHGKTKAEIDRAKLAVAKDRLEIECCKKFLVWFKDAKARDIAESNLSNADKIAALRQTYFADVDALEKSGQVQIPE